MAIDFNDSKQIYKDGGVIHPTNTWSLAVWYKTTGRGQGVFRQQQSTYYLAILNPGGNDTLRLWTTGITDNIQLTAIANDNQWRFVCLSFNGTSITHFTGLVGDSTTSQGSFTPSGTLPTGGNYGVGYDGEKLHGSAAEFASWSIALTKAEADSMLKGFSPKLIRPQSLVDYLPLIRDKQNITGDPFEESGTGFVYPHPRIYS